MGVQNVVVNVLRVRMVFAKQRKRSCDFLATPWFSVWTSQGLNLGPPDLWVVSLHVTVPKNIRRACRPKKKALFLAFFDYNPYLCNVKWYKAMITRAECIDILSSHASELRSRYGISSMRLFGSVARNSHKEGSDQGDRSLIALHPRAAYTQA